MGLEKNFGVKNILRLRIVLGFRTLIDTPCCWAKKVVKQNNFGVSKFRGIKNFYAQIGVKNIWGKNILGLKYLRVFLF